MAIEADDFFRGAYAGSKDDVQAVPLRLCRHMDVDPGHIELEFDDEDEAAMRAACRPTLSMARWATANGAASKPSLPSAATTWNYLAPLVDADGPTGEARATLRRYHELRWWLPVNELTEHIVRELRLVELTAALPRPRDHWRRLRFVVDNARAFGDAGGSGLAAFTAWAADQIDSDADVLETVVPEPDDDAVRIVTIHGSKGLEFPSRSSRTSAPHPDQSPRCCGRVTEPRCGSAASSPPPATPARQRSRNNSTRTSR